MEQREDTIDLSRLFSVMWARRGVIFGIIVTCTLIALIISFTLPKEYESTTLVQTRNAARVDTFGAAAAMAALGMSGGSGSITSPTMSYIELMKSRTVLDPIISNLDSSDEKKLDAKAFAKLRLDIRNAKGTNLIEVTARGRTPAEAQYISQAVVDNFLIMQTDMNQQTQSLLVQFLNTRIVDAKADADEAEQTLATYSREHKIYSPDDQAKAAIEQMAAFDKAISEVEVNAKSAAASLDVANAKLGEQKVGSKTYNISDNLTVQKIRDQIVAKRVELVGLEQRYTDQHPSVQQTRKELAQLQTSLDAEVAATVDSNAATLNPTYAELLKSKALAAVNLAVANASETALKAQQKRKEDELGGFPDDVMEYTRLSRDVKIKNEVYLNLIKQYEQNKTQQAMDSMDIQIVDPANLPDEDRPVAPRKGLMVLIGFVFGGMIALGYTFVAAWRS
ncbi:chain length determinant protein [Selenomonas sp. FOBRC9]|uniref:GumC family protein n=1 Tax=Selenomonas sp. FOBRC9 TaxID=936573 RepID=UPI00027A572E|nr:GumC family protein [Selenomonas sp. FOBRC9]EJP32612.1 chain length determinant protein [Selenomonas sp. FOBRC9]